MINIENTALWGVIEQYRKAPNRGVHLACKQTLQDLLSPLLSADKIEEPQGLGDNHKFLNPWLMQAHQMRMSDQRLPPVPTMTKDALLYGALMLEEVGETLQALGHALVSKSGGSVGQLCRISSMYIAQGVSMYSKASELRTLIAQCTEKIDESVLSLLYSKELLDGVTDTSVVVCGLANALGLPGGEAYGAVAISNISKRNPVTGKIDKDPSGKWLKGPNYKAPNLGPLLHQIIAPIEAKEQRDGDSTAV
jgi:hypothetical protein